MDERLPLREIGRKTNPHVRKPGINEINKLMNFGLCVEIIIESPKEMGGAAGICLPGQEEVSLVPGTPVAPTFAYRYRPAPFIPEDLPLLELAYVVGIGVEIRRKKSAAWALVFF